MRPFLLLATRAENEAADQEYAAFLQFGGLDEGDLVRHRLERDPLGEVDLDDYCGVILGGSPFTVSDPVAKKTSVQLRAEEELLHLMDRIVAQDHPFLGACYGIGILGTHQGAIIDGTYGEPVMPVQVSLTEEGKVDPLFYVLPPMFEAFVGHKEAITKLPEDAVGLASSPTCPVQAFRVGANVYATQFHPELDAPGIITRIEAYKHHGYFAPDDAERIKDSARRSNVSAPATLVRRFVQLYQD